MQEFSKILFLYKKVTLTVEPKPYMYYILYKVIFLYSFRDTSNDHHNNRICPLSVGLSTTQLLLFNLTQHCVLVICGQ